MQSEVEIAESKLESVSSITVPSTVNWSSDEEEEESETDNARNEIQHSVNPNQHISMDDDLNSAKILQQNFSKVF